MSISISFTDLRPDQVSAILQAAAPYIASNGGGQAAPAPVAPGGFPPPPSPAAAAPVPMPAAPTPPPAPAPAAPAANGKLGQVLATMDAYVKARGATGVADAKRVLAQVSIQRPQDANEQQLDWLLQAFANTTWVP